VSRKNVVRGFFVLENADLSVANTSRIVNVINLDKASIFVDWTGTALNSRLFIEAQNTQDGPWFDLFPNDTILLNGASGSHQIVLVELPHESIRVRTAPTAGTGSLDARLVAKTVGA
jgi:hypothetical protein